MNNKILYLDTVPCWYWLGWDKTTCSLLVFVADEFISTHQPIPHTAPLVQTIERKFEKGLFDSFSCNLQAEHFGFNHTIQKQPLSAGHTGFTLFSVPLPKIQVVTGICLRCGGKKEHDGLRCIECGGRGVSIEYDWDTAFRITTGLALLFMVLDCAPENDMPSAEPQLLTLSLCEERGAHGSSLVGELSRDGYSFFQAYCGAQSRRNKLQQKIADVLKTAWNRMAPLCHEHDQKYNLRAEVRYNAFGFNVPGDAAGVYTVPESFQRRSSGCEISCHNMDNPMQALCCLAGLGVLVQELRQFSANKTQV